MLSLLKDLNRQNTRDQCIHLLWVLLLQMEIHVRPNSLPSSHIYLIVIVRSPYPPPGLRGVDDRERDRQDRDRVVSDRSRNPNPNQNPAQTPTQPAAQSQQIASPPVQLSDLDPDNVSRELKKEGGDWVAVWSSQSKKLLDVSLVHTLNHET